MTTYICLLFEPTELYLMKNVHQGQKDQEKEMAALETLVE
jgi:hypothetical protein